MQKLLFAAALLTIAACSDDKKKDAPPAGGSAKTPPAGKTTTPTPTPTASAEQLTCDRILPMALRDKYFAKAKFTDTPQGTTFSAQCTIEDGSPVGASISVSCHDNVAAAMEITMKGLREDLKADDLPGVGKGAASVDMGAGGRMVSAWDDDSNCQVTLSIPATIDPVAFTRELLAVYPLK